MKIILESTDKIVTLGSGAGARRMRIWQGTTESGVPVHAYIAFVSPEIGDDDPRQGEFQAELEEHSRARPTVRAIDARMIL